jgi:1,4-alpha-glucan branching enzyme
MKARVESRIEQQVKGGVTLFTDYDVYLFKEGNHFRLYEKLGSHLMTIDGERGTYFAAWAPNAKAVSVVGDFNFWNPNAHPLIPRWDGSGIWEGFIPGLEEGTLYKYHIVSNVTSYRANKGDPFALYWECPPKTSPVIWNLDYEWNDSQWMKVRKKHNDLSAPYSIYEMHLGSWRRKSDEECKTLSYREIAPELAEYVKKMGFTHIEFLPIMEHPFYGSWGYQTVGYFAPTSRYGTPQDFMYLIDYLHQQGIGVILDWVPSHFPGDEHGLAYYDGTCVYEHADPKKGFHPDWKSYIFNYGRNEVQAFLLSSALFWLEKYHIDGLRVDAVASMLYLDYSRKGGEWIPNCFGGRENLEAIAFLKRFNEEVYKAHPDVQTMAEESTAWPMVSRPVYVGGLGFGMKWNMGWMHDTLVYMAKDPVYRKYHHSELTFSMLYAFTENYVLPLSHDEVVHGKGSLVNKMPGDDWQRLANLRLLLTYQFMHPGKKLLFMGSEFAQWAEWNHDTNLEWHLTQWERHTGVQKLVADLNRLYSSIPALHKLDFDPKGFEWVDCNDWENSILSFIRKGTGSEEVVLIVCNFTPVSREKYRVGVPFAGYWEEILNSDSDIYGGSGLGNAGGVVTENTKWHNRPQSVLLKVPPLGAVVFKYRTQEEEIEIADREKAEKEKAEREKAEREKAEREKAEREKAEREKAEREKAEREKAEREKAEREKAEREKAEREKAEREKAEREKAEREKAEREKAEREKAEREKAEREKAEREKAEREKAEREKAEREKAEREKAEREKAERVKAERVKAEKEKAEKEAKEKKYQIGSKTEGKNEEKQKKEESGTNNEKTA